MLLLNIIPALVLGDPLFHTFHANIIANMGTEEGIISVIFGQTPQFLGLLAFTIVSFWRGWVVPKNIWLAERDDKRQAIEATTAQTQVNDELAAAFKELSISVQAIEKFIYHLPVPNGDIYPPSAQSATEGKIENPSAQGKG